MMGERCLEDDDDMLNVHVNTDVVHEVFRRLDGITIARAACAAPIFHLVSDTEKVWESLCNQQWPSTKEPEIRHLIHDLGGFQQFYMKCFPLIVGNRPRSRSVTNEAVELISVSWAAPVYVSECVTSVGSIGNAAVASVDDIVSIVDVVFQGRSVASRVLHGIPGVSDIHGWFSNSPFRLDVVNFDNEDEDQASSNDIVIDNGLPTVLSIQKERKNGRLWKVLWEEIRVSWIVVNKKTRQMANLSSWMPLKGRRHWPSDKHFMLRFGSIIPVQNSLVSSSNLVQCNVVLKCKLLSDSSVAEEKRRSSLLITELSMQLEDMSGTHLNGSQSLLALVEALSCQKSTYHNRVLNTYRKHMRVQSELKEASLRREGRIDTIFIVFGIILFLSFCYWIF